MVSVLRLGWRLVVVVALIGAIFLFGCELGDPPLPLDGDQGGFGLTLVYPPDAAFEEIKSEAKADSIRAWLFWLGSDEQAAYEQYPIPGHSDWTPAAYAISAVDEPLEFEIDAMTDETWWRLFVYARGLRGRSTFPLFPEELERSVNVVMALENPTSPTVLVYEPIAGPSLSQAVGQVDTPQGFLYPIGIGNDASLSGIDLRFLTSATDSIDVYVDPGSRLYGLGEQDAFELDLETFSVEGAARSSHRIRIDFPDTTQQTGVVVPGNDVLFYMVAYGDTSSINLCVHPESALFSLLEAQAGVVPQVINPSQCVSWELPEVAVLYPAGGEAFSGEETIQIEWSVPEGWGDQVGIELLSFGEVCSTITESTPNDGFFSWPVAQCGIEIRGYSIRVTDLGSGTPNQDEGTFTIGAPCEITVTAPVGETTWTEGETQEIRWDSGGLCGETVQIELFLEEMCYQIINFAAPNTGSYFWSELDRCNQIADGYQIRITDNDSGASGDSSGSIRIYRRVYLQPDGSGDYPTIQKAIYMSPDGTLILLADGSYSGYGNFDINFSGKEIVVASQSGNPSDCIIACGFDHQGFLFQSGEGPESKLMGIQIQSGWASPLGGGVLCDGSSPTIENCIFNECHAEYGGGLACTNESSPTVSYCQFLKCSANNYGGGVHCEGGSAPEIFECDFRYNTVWYAGGGLSCLSGADVKIYGCNFDFNSTPVGDTVGGGAIFVEGATTYFEQCIFNTNSASSGGGANIRSSTGSQFVDCNFLRNTADGGGGAVSQWNSETSFIGCDFTSNGALSYGNGGAFNCRGSQLVLATCEFSENYSNNNGGVFYLWESNISADQCEFLNNEAPGNEGGVLVSNNSSHLFRSCQFYGNSASYGAVAYYVSGYAKANERKYVNCTLADNASGITEEAAIIYSPETSVEIVNSIIAFNLNSAAVYCYGNEGVTITCCNIFGNSRPGGCIAGQIGYDGNVALDPQFCDRLDGNFNLNSSSPCAPENSGGCAQIGALGVGCAR